MSNELGIGEKVFFPGWIDKKEMSNYLNAADIYVSTSFSDGTSCSLLEAMACSLPVVVTNIEGNLEYIKDGVNKIIADKINKLLKFSFRYFFFKHKKNKKGAVREIKQ